MSLISPTGFEQRFHTAPLRQVGEAPFPTPTEVTTLARMADTPPPRITVDFNFGGRLESGEGVTMLYFPKLGESAGLNPRMRGELEDYGYEPQEGMTVRLVDPGADLDDDGRPCDMQVDARIVIYPDQKWAAIWDWDAMKRVPSDPDVSS